MLGREGEPLLVDTRRAQPTLAEPSTLTLPSSQQQPAAEFLPPESAVEAAKRAAEPKFVDLGDVRYPCIPKLPALSQTDMLKSFNALGRIAENAKTMGKNLDNAEKATEVMADMIEMLDLLVEDDYLEALHKHLRRKTDVIEYSEILSEIMRLFPLYSGTSAGKLRAS